MAIIIIPVLLILFIMIILLGIMFKKKIWLYLIIGVAVIAGSTFILKNTVFYFNSDTIYVQKGEYESFEIKIQNHKIRYQGGTIRFSCKYSESELLRHIAEQYPAAYYDEQLNQIIIIEDNEIFSINKYGKSNFLWHREDKYALTQNYVIMEMDSPIMEMEDVYIPFPAKAIISDRALIEPDMKLTCDFNHLIKYYKEFTNVEIGENTIEIMLKNYKCIMTVNGDDIHFELTEIEK